jgi:hypothetical protein
MHTSTTEVELKGTKHWHKVETTWNIKVKNNSVHSFYKEQNSSTA